LDRIQTDLSVTSFFHDALCLLVPFMVDVFVPGIFWVAVDSISIDKFPHGGVILFNLIPFIYYDDTGFAPLIIQPATETSEIL